MGTPQGRGQMCPEHGHQEIFNLGRPPHTHTHSWAASCLPHRAQYSGLSTSTASQCPRNTLIRALWPMQESSLLGLKITPSGTVVQDLPCLGGGPWGLNMRAPGPPDSGTTQSQRS